MMKFPITLMLLLLAQLLCAQNNAQIKGKVYDSHGKPMEKATVSIVSDLDSIVLTYGLTDEKGQFDLVKLPSQKPLTLYVSHVNSSLPYQKRVVLKAGEKLQLDSIALGENMIEEVLVTAQAPIRLNGDTLEYKADYFKTRPNASVEELLQILPGLQVNSDGSIYYQGREVTGIRVNNKDFFVQDLKIATRNLDASLIDVVQIIKDKGESKREIIDDTDLPIVINLKMKKEFLKANFGKLYGGLGNLERYESGALVNTFRDTLQVSFIGYANNINRQGFDYSEMSQYGGLERGENMSFRMYGGSGLINQVSAGVNVNYDIAKKLKTNLMYSYNQANFDVVNENQTIRNYGPISEEANANSDFNSGNFSHSIRGLIRYHLDSTSQITYTGNLENRKFRSDQSGSSMSQRTDGQKVLESSNQGYSNNTSSNYYHRLYFEKKFQNKWLLSANHNLNQTDEVNRADNYNRMLYYLLQDSLVDQQRLTRYTNLRWNINNKINLQIPWLPKLNNDYYVEYNKSQDKLLQDIANRINSDELIPRNDIANDRSQQNNYWIVGTQWNIRLLKNLPISVGLRWMNLERRIGYFSKLADRNEQNAYWLPSANISYKGFTVNYNRDLIASTLSNIVVVDNDLNPNSINYASPYFDNVLSDSYSVRYNKYFTKSKINLAGSVRLTHNNNSIANYRSYDVNTSFTGSQFYMAPGTDSYYINGNVSKAFIENKTWRLRYSSNAYFWINENYLQVNDEENRLSRTSGEWNNVLFVKYKNYLTLNLSYGISFEKNQYQTASPNFPAVNNSRHLYGSSLMLENIHKFRLETSYVLRNQVVNVNNQRSNRHIINASIYYPVFKKGELKFSAFDILNQNQYNNYYSFENGSGFQRGNSLSQYFMLGMVYKFLKTN